MYIRFSVSLHALFILIITLLGCVSGTKRELKCVINPGLNGTSPEEVVFNVVHIIAKGPEDTVHFIWSTYNLPSIIIARTSNAAELLINFTDLSRFEKHAISFSEEPFESFGLTFTEVWEFSDTSDLADLTKSSSINPINMEMLRWTDINDTLQCSSSLVTANLKSFNDEPSFSQNGTFDVQFSTVGDQVPSDQSPHLIYTGNSTEIRILLNKLSPNITKPRYAVELKAFSSPTSKHGKWSKSVSISIDDEFSPGVFQKIELNPPCEGYHDDNCNTFLFWKPVSYTGAIPLIANSSDAKMYDYIETSIGTPHSIAEVYFDIIPNSSVIAFNVSFGTINDGYYAKTRYLSWTLMVGTGRAFSRDLSLAAILFITSVLGALTLFILGGGIFVLCQRCKRKDDDLLLSDSSINH